ncbi:truB domain-containing protein [Bacillus phage Bcp1]|uniref:TruB domain-containing protein n=1 Tax=Bacillus phage Bcp1 TaxID=584892 RepID=X2JUC4_9CAUD|nr:truB domain-containing protein [Bacillus phage Bcp1]AHN66506.1 truB domain-containing protein [Bacillus phage Bcp1]
MKVDIYLMNRTKFIHESRYNYIDDFAKALMDAKNHGKDDNGELIRTGDFLWIGRKFVRYSDIVLFQESEDN